MDLFELNGRVVVNLADALKAFDEIQKAGQKTESKLGKFFAGIGKGAAVVGKAVGVGMVAAGTAVAGLVGQATSAYAEYEQLVGGVETLFKDSSSKVMEYAQKAYETAGMSANEYMNTVTSFSASLLQSLGGDTEKAADKADVAIRDMSDNANKMGTSMEMIQNAYQGFAKQNYTMLDNLKLGYGGTKEEMARLLKDAEKLSGQKFDLSSYADIVDAIHVIQTEMGITGTTADEAAGTISGSMASVKGAWQNLVTAMASDDLPVDEYIDKFVNSATTMAGNMLPRIGKALEGVGELITKLAPVISEKLPALMQEILPSLISAAGSLLVSLAKVLPELAMILVQQIPVIVNMIKQELFSKFPQLEAPFKTIENLFKDVWTGIKEFWESSGKPIFESIKNIFEAVKTALDPLISAFKDYVSEGGLASDITDTLKFAGDALKLAFEAVEGIITGIVTGYQDMVTWGKENELALGLIALAVGTLTAAIVAYNVAQAIKNAGGIVELAQLALLQIQMWGLSAAEAAHAAASTIATVATTAFGAAMAFLTSPITLVVLAIGALIAIIVLCVKYWDEIKAAGAKAWEWIKNAWSKAGEWFAGIWKSITGVFANVGGWFKDKFTDAWNKIKAVFSGVKTFFTDLWGGIKDAFSELGTKISDSISAPVKKAINNVIGGAENIINGFFGLINGAIGEINKIPGVNIQKIKLVEFTRLAKGGVVDKATPAIFGEDGAEAVVPLENNTGWLDKVALRLYTSLSKQTVTLGGGASTVSVELQQAQVAELKTLNGTAYRILEAILALDENMGGNLRDALDGMSIGGWNKREFARLVKEVS